MRSVALAVAVSVSVFVVCAFAFSAAVLRCSTENQSHHPSACSLSDHHPKLLFFGALGLTFAICALGPLGGRELLLTAAGFVAAAYVGYAVAVYVT